MRLLYDSKHIYIILICQWRGMICEMAEVTFVAETLRHACEFLGYFTHIVFSYFVCGFCGFSGYCGFQNRRNRNNRCLYFCVFFLNKQICITDSFSIDYADLPNYLITLPPHFYGHSTNVLLRVLCPPFLCSWRAVENLFSEGIPNPYRRST